MQRIQFKTVVPHIALGLVSLLLIVGLFALGSSEQKKTRDIVRMQEMVSLRSALRMYYIDHAAYPPSPVGTQQIGSGDHQNLCDAGFVPQNDDSCGKKTYGRMLPAGFQLQPDDSYTYTPLAENGVEPCTSTAGCPRFAIRGMFETDVLYPKGVHALTDQGMQ